MFRATNWPVRAQNRPSFEISSTLLSTPGPIEFHNSTCFVNKAYIIFSECIKLTFKV